LSALRKRSAFGDYEPDIERGSHGDGHAKSRLFMVVACEQVDALDLIEGVLRSGFNLASVSRIAQARGPNFWIGAAIGAAAVVLINKPDGRAAVAGVFRKGSSSQSRKDTSPADNREAASPKVA
jgi:hypothetical protein